MILRASAITLFLFFVTISWGQKTLPDFTGKYYFTTVNAQKISSTIYSKKAFSLKTPSDTKYISVNRIIDKIGVMDVVTYFLDTNVRSEKTGKTERLELMMVENVPLKKIRLELETGEEWVRLVSNSSGTQSSLGE